MITKTGTTIVGLKFKGGVILCADTRSTDGPIVADKNCSKIHKITDKIYSCGAGTAADTRRVCRKAAHNLSIFEGNYGRLPRLIHCITLITQHLFNHGGSISAALIIGGVDDEGAHLYEVHPHGSSSSVSYTAMGSGCLSAIAILESGFKELERDEAITLGVAAVEAGILNDLYSGSNVDVCIITRDSVEYLRNHKKVAVRNEYSGLTYPRSSVEILKEDIVRLVEES